MSEPTPCVQLIQGLAAEMRRHVPFGQMSLDALGTLVASARQTYYAPGEAVLAPADGPVQRLFYIRRGAIRGHRSDSADQASLFQHEAGDLFPIGAMTGRRAVTARYVAEGDTFCLEFPAEMVLQVAQVSAPLADFLNGRVQQYLALSRQALQQSYAAQALAEQSLEARLDSLPTKEPIACKPDTPLVEALGFMHRAKVGSVLVLDASGAAQGILTLQDVLPLLLDQVPLATPVRERMSTPVHTLEGSASLQAAALLMARQGIRHVPITHHGRVVSLVSERDLFSVQRLSLKHVSGSIRVAPDLPALQAAAQEIRKLAGTLLAQGVQARQLTELVSQLNDLLAERLVQLMARSHGLGLSQACWLAFGSEGRGEQTIATDQDNGLILAMHDPAAQLPRWLAMAEDVNQALHLCGYPLCKGNIMARNPQCCLTQAQWLERFTRWMEQGAPEDLLNASIFFDLRALAGNVQLAAPLAAMVRGRAQELPRFIRQLVANSLRNRPALNWLGALDLSQHEGLEGIDLKLHGTAIAVDVARIYALALGVQAHGTSERLAGVAKALNVQPAEGQAWSSAFEFLQMLRLRIQIEGPDHANPNFVAVGQLNDIDRRMLKESLRVIKRLQQRLEMDYAA